MYLQFELRLTSSPSFEPEQQLLALVVMFCLFGGLLLGTAQAPGKAPFSLASSSGRRTRGQGEVGQASASFHPWNLITERAATTERSVLSSRGLPPGLSYREGVHDTRGERQRW